MRPLPRAMTLAMLLGACWAVAVAGQSITNASPEQLRRWLRQYPEADADKDGVLTVEEAEAYRRVLQRQQAVARSAPKPRFRHEYAFATMSDGVKIALAVGYPKGFDPADQRGKWPAMLCACGYAFVTEPTDPAQYADRCVTVNMSIRGTGASGGALSPWTPRTWQDGHEVIEHWIVKQPWSNGKVGVHGYSWPGLIGFLIATTQPPSLAAVCVGGLIDDFYRGICYPGGVRNRGFPVDWLNNYYGPNGPFGSGAAAMAARGLTQSEYLEIVASRPRRDLTEDNLWHLLHEPLDGPKWRQQSLGTHASRIRAPILIGHSWQDEQTGPTGWRLWKRIPDDVPKRLALTNGNHGVAAPHADVAAWFGHWLFGADDPRIADPEARVQCFFETRAKVRAGPAIHGQPLAARDFPLPETDWRRYFLRAGHGLSLDPPDKAEAPDSYTVSHDDPKAKEGRAVYVLDFPQTTAICGPAMLTLWATLTTLDTDFFVLLADQSPDGRLYGLQRGLLRASHRRVDGEQSDWVAPGGQRLLVRPHHAHDRPQPVTPQEPTEYQIEIPAVGHVFRAGHKLALLVTRPPQDDPIGVTKSGSPSYRYDSHPPPATVTILHDADHPSSLLLPVLPQLPPLSVDPVPLDQQAGLQPAG